MKIGYARVSKSDGSQTIDLQEDALQAVGVLKEYIYSDRTSGSKEDRPGLNSCLQSLRSGDVLIVWKLDRLGRSLKHLIEIVQKLNERNIGFKVLSGQGANMDTTTAAGKLVFGIFAALAEFESELIKERTLAGLASARARGRVGGRKYQLSKAKVRLAQAAMKCKDTVVSELCEELGVTRQTLYRYVSPNGELRKYGSKVLSSGTQK